MKDRSWSCSVSKTCLRNTVTSPVALQERPPNSKSAISKRTVRQSEAMPSPTIDLPVTHKEGVDALNTLILRKLAKESFINEGVPRKSGYPGEYRCDRKVGSRETLREARSTSISCKCGSNGGKELISSFPNPHDNALCAGFTKNNLAPFDSAKIPDGVSSLLSRIGLDSRKKSDQDLLGFQNSSRFDRAPQHRTFGTTQIVQKCTRSQDSDEEQSASTYSSSREFLSISAAQATNPKSSMHAVGQMWCIPEANSGDFIRTEFSPFHRCSAANYEEATSLKSEHTCALSTNDELAAFESNLLRPHVNSPIHSEHAHEEVITQSSLRNSVSKGIPIRLDETADFHSSRCKPRIDSTLSGRDLIRKIFREEGEFKAALLKRAPWSEELRTAEHVHWNLRELMQREEVEEDVDASSNTFKDEHTVEQRSFENDYQLDELARSLARNQPSIKQENCSSDCGTPRRIELGIAASKSVSNQNNSLTLEDRGTESNTTSKIQLFEEKTILRVLGQKERTEGRVSMRQNPVFSSCISGVSKIVDSKEENMLCQGEDLSPDPSNVVVSSDVHDDSAASQELDVDWETGRDDLEILLKFLIMKQQLRESRRNDAEVVVNTEAIVRDLISEMKLDSDFSPSVDLDASLQFLQWSHAGEPVVDDCFVEGKERKELGEEALIPVGMSNAVVHDVSPGLTSEGTAGSEVVCVLKNQKVNHLCTPEEHRLPVETPSASKFQSLQLMIGSKSIQRTRSCSMDFRDTLCEEHVGMVADPSEEPEETRKRTGSSRMDAHRTECCTTTKSAFSNDTLPTQRRMTELVSDEIVRVGDHCYVVKGESSSVTRMQSVNERNVGTRGFNSAERNGTSLSGEASCALMSSQLMKDASKSPTAYVMPLRSGSNLESRSIAGNSPTIPWNYQREKLLAVGRNVQPGSPKRRTTVKSPATSPQNHRQCRDSPRTKFSPNNKSSPMASPRKQQRPLPASAALNLSAAQFDAQTSSQTISEDPMKNFSQDVDSFPLGISDMAVQESVALAKDSNDPYADFRDSMLEMMQEKNLWQRQDELQYLLQCFLHLNEPVHHHLIHQAFSDVVSHGSPLNYLGLNRETKLSKDILTKQSSPPNQQNEVV